MSYIAESDFSELRPWIRNEIVYQRTVRKGSRGRHVIRVQEWLRLHGHGVDIDGAYGPVTARAVARFQDEAELSSSGIANKATFEELVAPMRRTLVPQMTTDSIPEGVVAFGQAHLAEHPREVGGANKGPWVRLYMKGKDGPSRLWCAGFVTFLLHQAAEAASMQRPIRGSNSCDSLAAQARETGRFVRERSIDSELLEPGSIFLVRRSSTDWTHTGIVVDASEQEFVTIEGNTNDDGNREGYEVCSMSRGYRKKDFITLS